MAEMRKLYRSTHDRKLAGVCGGLGEYFNIDATIVRLIWLVGSFFTAFVGGLILYFLVSLIVPNDPGYTDI